MWQTPEQAGITDQEWIDAMVEKLWEDEQKRVKNPCTDCGVKVGEQHLEECDVARCTNCGRQRISCDCPDGVGEPDVWTGIWPGVETAYKHKLICRWSGTGEWGFDLNRAAVIAHTQDEDAVDDEDSIEDRLNQFQYDTEHNERIVEAIRNLRQVFKEELLKTVTEAELDSPEANEWFEEHYNSLKNTNVNDIRLEDILMGSV